MEWIKQIVQALVIVLLQVLLFNHLQIAGWGFPMVYVLILMNLPVQIPRWLEMLIGATIGLMFDIWSSSLGVNMAACVAFSFLRPILLSNGLQDVERIKGEVCSLSIGRIDYVKCLVFLVLIHHLMVFALETWSWSNWWIVLLQTLISSILTILIIIGYDIFKQ
jgi:rod shape-determining protein MreD